MKISRDGKVLIFVFLLLVIGGAFLARPEHNKANISSTYSVNPHGVKAFYVLLSEHLGYHTGRLRRPYDEIPKNAEVLVVVQPLKDIPITSFERGSLKKWIHRGGVAVFLSDSLDGIPAVFGSTRQYGNGYIYAFNSRRFITNRGVRNYHNALKVLNIIARHASRKDLVLFDEYHHGYVKLQDDDISSIRLTRQSKIAIWVMVAAGLAMCYAQGRRFGAVRRLQTAGKIRPEYEFVESIGRLYSRAGATDVAASILWKSLKQGLCTKLGLSTDVSNDVLLRQLSAAEDEELAKKIEKLLPSCEPAKAGEKISRSELLIVAKEIQQVEASCLKPLAIHLR